MRVRIFPSRASGQITVPPSKSVAHRALICAALTEESVISGVGKSRDIEVTLDCLEKMGARIKRNGEQITLGGFDPFSIPDGCEIYCHESGSTLRFLIPFCMLSQGNVKISGAPRLMERPLTVYKALTEKLGINFDLKDGSLTVGSGLVAGDYEVPGDVSSQFITGLLFALSCIPKKSTLTVTGKFESASYVDLTLGAMKDFGRIIERQGRVFTVSPLTRYEKNTIEVEGDWSAAAFPDALNLLGGNVEVLGLRKDTLQGDAVYRSFFERLSCGFAVCDLGDCPDTAPILFAVAAALNGGEFINTARLKIKESDRAQAMKEELEKLGGSVAVEENRVIVSPSKLTRPTAPISSHNDHRIAMAMATLLTLVGGEIEGAEAVEKSYPEFWNHLEQLKIGIEYEA